MMLTAGLLYFGVIIAFLNAQPPLGIGVVFGAFGAAVVGFVLSAAIITYRIVDIVGRQIRVEPLIGNTVNVQSLTNGIYIIQIY